MSNHLSKEDYSVDMRTILAKERTIMSQQRLQLNLVGIGLGLFAAGVTLLKAFDGANSTIFWIELTFIFAGAILCTLAVLQYYYLAKELRTFEVMEMEYVHVFRSQKANEIFETLKKK